MFTLATLPDTPFWRAYAGRFQGILTWPKFDALWQVLADHPDHWFVFALHDDVAGTPQAPLEPESFRDILGDARDMYVPFRKLSHCGAVYVDDPVSPNFVKVFDPAHMGAVCGGGEADEITLPRWTFSRMRPDAGLSAPPAPARRGLLSRLAGR